MKLHFASTAPRFRYFQYLAVLSALHSHKVEGIFIWTFNEPDCAYWDKVKKVSRIEKVLASDLPFEPKTKHPANIADYLRIKALYEHGGLYLDLDTFSFTDITHLLRKEVFFGFQHPEGWNTQHPIECCMMMAKRQSEIMGCALEYSIEGLRQDKMDWGDASLIPIAKAIRKFYDEKRIDIAPYDEFFYYGWGNWKPYEEIPDLPLGKSKILHLWAKLNPYLDQITPEWMERSQSLYARLVKSTLPKEVWKA